MLAIRNLTTGVNKERHILVLKISVKNKSTLQISRQDHVQPAQEKRQTNSDLQRKLRNI